MSILEGFSAIELRQRLLRIDKCISQLEQEVNDLNNYSNRNNDHLIDQYAQYSVKEEFLHLFGPNELPNPPDLSPQILSASNSAAAAAAASTTEKCEVTVEAKQISAVTNTSDADAPLTVASQSDTATVPVPSEADEQLPKSPIATTSLESAVATANLTIPAASIVATEIVDVCEGKTSESVEPKLTESMLPPATITTPAETKIPAVRMDDTAVCDKLAAPVTETSSAPSADDVIIPAPKDCKHPSPLESPSHNIQAAVETTSKPETSILAPEQQFNAQCSSHAVHESELQSATSDFKEQSQEQIDLQQNHNLAHNSCNEATGAAERPKAAIDQPTAEVDQPVAQHLDKTCDMIPAVDASVIDESCIEDQVGGEATGASYSGSGRKRKSNSLYVDDIFQSRKTPRGAVSTEAMDATAVETSATAAEAMKKKMSPKRATRHSHVGAAVAAIEAPTEGTTLRRSGRHHKE